ncbi:MAG TPA: carboxypeptidase-like regulatory domain-containing protein, partial [Beijerinckiaceae bacterium]|nr:carboxypeptidase-like regulatory domain-containing protein [Beijerinckiaceae bacterium]
MLRKPLAIGLLGATALASLAITATAQTTAPALSGKVTSQAEGAMEGVIVSAKREGGTMTVSVVSDAQGEYHFPASRLDPGKYDVTIRAVGYDLSAPASVDVGAQSPGHLDLTLNTTKDLTAQLSNAEWLLSMPGDDKEKAQIGQNCVTCHTVKRIVSSTHDAAEMARVVQRMQTHTNNASPVHPYFFPSATATMAKAPTKGEAALGQFISTVNLST